MNAHTFRLSHIYLLALAFAVGPLARAARSAALTEEELAVWTQREKAAVTPASRAELAGSMIAAARTSLEPGGNVYYVRPTLLDSRRFLPALSEEGKHNLLLLCDRIYAVGSQQSPSYGAAAEALGAIELIDPSRHLDCLSKLAKLYSTEYRKNTTANVGMAKGLAHTNLLIARERWTQLSSKADSDAKSAEDFAKQAREINELYVEALATIRPAISSIRSAIAAAENPAPSSTRTEMGPNGLIRTVTVGGRQVSPITVRSYRAYVTDAEALEVQLAAGAATVQDAIRKTDTLIQARKTLQIMLDRLKKTPTDTLAADRIVRLCLNELPDPATLQSVLPKSSPAARDAIAAMAQSVSKLSAAEALATANWIAAANTTPDSLSYIDLLIRARAYLQRCAEAAPTGPEAKQAKPLLTRLDADLLKVRITPDAADLRVASYIDSIDHPNALAAISPQVISPPPIPTPTATRPPSSPAREPVILGIIPYPNATTTNPASLAAANPPTTLPSTTVAVAPPPAATLPAPATDQTSTDNAWDRYRRSLPKAPQQDPAIPTGPSIFDFGREGL